MGVKHWKAALLLLLLPASLWSQPRSLHWQSLEVEARLDGDGRLHVRERHHMVFTGDWNGGQRGFRLESDQRLELQGIEREDLETHSRVPLAESRDLSRIDDYAWTDSTTLRWRSRLPSDPPFQNAERVYVLDYTLENILVPTEEGYLLDHDFAFPERPGPILSFSLELSLDGIWSPKEELAARIVREKLQPGESVVVRAPLGYRGEGAPSAVRLGAAAPIRGVLSLSFAAALAAIAFLFHRGEEVLGRFAPLTPVSAIDRSWLDANVFSMLPEEVGAAWDESTSAPEVAAVIARLVSEGKLKTEVYRTPGLFKSSEHLRMELLVDRDSFSGYEGILVRALFVSGKVTDTVKIRKHYEDRGFNPASLLRDPLKQRVRRLLSRSGATRQVSRKPALWLLFASLLVLAASALFDPKGTLLLLPRLLFSTFLYGLGLIAALVYRKRVEGLLSGALPFLVPAASLAAIAFSLLYFNPERNGFLALFGFSLFLLALLTSLFNMAKFRQGSHAIELRKKLASARRYFARELSQPDPRLEDRWFPYLIAFELGPDVDRWFRAYGAVGRASGTSTDFPSTSSGGSGSSSSRPWTGGGGAFGGAGATGSWAAAVGGVAAGVAAPSESSGGSGGGGGGGGSSGGGSGGGW